jgi:hypothetical protein
MGLPSLMTLSSERHFRPRAAFLAATALNPLKPLFKRALRPLVERLARAGVTANQVTIISLVGSLLSVHADGGPVWGLLPAWMLARMALATIDGMLAIDFGQKSRLGSILNEVGDVISDIASLPRPAIQPGAMTPFWPYTARSKTGRARQILPGADAMVCSTSPHRSSRTPSQPRCSTPPPNLASLSSTM